MTCISILVAVRNESANIISCLQSLENLNYGKNYATDYRNQNLEILIGNDASEDNTEELIQNFIADKPHFQLVSIKTQVAKLHGKPNVLAQLAHHAHGEWLFFTDADVQVPIDWIDEMLCHEKHEIALITGFTSIIPTTFFATLQALDWTFYLGCMHIFSSLNLPMTAMGNNMAVRKQVYDAVGGYENIAFSVTEDYALFKTITTQGFGFQQLASEKVLAFTKPSVSLSDFIQQRQRWLGEFCNFPFWIKAMILSAGFHLPFFCLLLCYGFAIGNFAIFITCYSLRFMLINSILAHYIHKTKQTKLFFYLLIYDLFHLLFSFIFIINFLKNLLGKSQIKWKGRVYER